MTILVFSWNWDSRAPLYLHVISSCKINQLLFFPFELVEIKANVAYGLYYLDDLTHQEAAKSCEQPVLFRLGRKKMVM